MIKLLSVIAILITSLNAQSQSLKDEYNGLVDQNKKSQKNELEIQKSNFENATIYFCIDNLEHGKTISIIGNQVAYNFGEIMQPTLDNNEWRTSEKGYAFFQSKSSPYIIKNNSMTWNFNKVFYEFDTQEGNLYIKNLDPKSRMNNTISRLDKCKIYKKGAISNKNPDSPKLQKNQNNLKNEEPTEVTKFLLKPMKL